MMIGKRNFLYTLLCVGALALCACGVKPQNADPPESIKQDKFPRTYPDINTDPPVQSQ